MLFLINGKARIILAVIIIVVFSTLIALIYILNQPKYTPINEFNRDNLDLYDAGSIFYIKDEAIEVEFVESVTGSMLDWDEYDVYTKGGYKFSTSTTDVGEAPNIHPGTPVVLKIEIYETWQTHTKGYSVSGYAETEFVLKYNDNWIAIFILGTLMFLCDSVILLYPKIRKLNLPKKIQLLASLCIIDISAFFFYIFIFLDWGPEVCYFSIGIILLVFSMMLLYLSIKEKSEN